MPSLNSETSNAPFVQDPLRPVNNLLGPHSGPFQQMAQPYPSHSHYCCKKAARSSRRSYPGTPELECMPSHISWPRLKALPDMAAASGLEQAKFRCKRCLRCSAGLPLLHRFLAPHNTHLVFVGSFLTADPQTSTFLHQVQLLKDRLRNSTVHAFVKWSGVSNAPKTTGRPAGLHQSTSTRRVLPMTSEFCTQY